MLKHVIPTPDLFERDALTADHYPVFLKPDAGQGSKGTQLVRTAEELDFYLAADPALLILEYLPGPEYTVDCFTASSGELLFAEGRERRRVSNGISVNSATVVDERFKTLARAINASIDFRGTWFFQVKERADGELTLLEIAPRIAGTMGLVRCKGVNLPLLSLFDRMGLAVSVSENDYAIEVDRALENRYAIDLTYNHVYLDFDDMVVFDGKVVPRVMAFVYQCIGEGIKVHLITRHAADIRESLEAYRLTGVFDDIIWLPDPDAEKYRKIPHKDAIFIDDSFEERRKVREQRGIPVFDYHMIESLLKH